MQVGVKCRPSINCSCGRVYGQIKSRKIRVNKHLLDNIYLLHKSRHSSLELRRRPKNIISILNLFFSVRAWIIERLYFLYPLSERPQAPVFDTRDHELVQHDVYCLLFIVYCFVCQKNYTNQIKSNYLNSHGEEAQEKPPGL